MIVFWGTITVENLLGLEGFLGTPKKEKRKKKKIRLPSKFRNHQEEKS